MDRHISKLDHIEQGNSTMNGRYFCSQSFKSIEKNLRKRTERGMFKCLLILITITLVPRKKLRRATVAVIVVQSYTFELRPRKKA